MDITYPIPLVNYCPDQPIAQRSDATGDKQRTPFEYSAGFSTSTYEHNYENCNVIKGKETRRNRRRIESWKTKERQVILRIGNSGE